MIRRFMVSTIILVALVPALESQEAKTKASHAWPIGHRGLMKLAPENTLVGFAACIELRVGFELDIRRTKDGVLVVMHDPDVKRTTNGAGKVAELTLAELRKLDAGSWFERGFAGTRVPTLDEVFALLKERGAI